jgi:CheY-like chemotaxis protein
MVYLVDDDDDDLEIVQTALIENSYKGPVKTVSNGQMLMDKLNGHDNGVRPDVILLDLNMPLKDGFEALEELKANPVLKSIPVIILTASSKKEDEIRCFELGCNYFYTKPNSVPEYSPLVKMVKKFIGNKAA